jgi:hypothetical protein
MLDKRTGFFIAAALVLAVVYLTLFIDWHHGKKIQIMCRIFPAGALGGTSSQTVTFYLDKPYPLTSIKVFSADEARTNKYPHALWHLVAKTNSHPATAFTYGAAIAGMQPDVPNTTPEPLQADQNYSVEVEVGNGLKGELTFHPPASNTPGN